VITIIRQKIVIRAQEPIRNLLHHAVDLSLCAEREALQNVAAPCAAGRLELGSRPVDAGGVALVMAAVGVFAAADYDARVQEAAADGPEDGGQAAGLLGVLVGGLEQSCRAGMGGVESYG